MMKTSVRRSFKWFLQLAACLESIGALWENFYHELVRADFVQLYAYRAPTVTPPPHTRGRPRYLISQDQLEYLRSLGFTWTDVSVLLGVSRMTLYRYRREYEMLHDDDTRLISDSDLREILRIMRMQHPKLWGDNGYGSRLVIGIQGQQG